MDVSQSVLRKNGYKEAYRLRFIKSENKEKSQKFRPLITLRIEWLKSILDLRDLFSGFRFIIDK